MKIILAGYRSWAIKAFNQIIERYPHVDFEVVNNQEDLSKYKDSVILCAGWSWIFKKRFIENNEMICLMHPSDLPEYAGGSPIQNQVINGVEETKATLFKADYNIDTGPIIKKTNISLMGDVSQIFLELQRVTVILFAYFIDNYKNKSIKLKNQVVTKTYKRLKPDQSKLTKSMLESMSVKQIYDFIRCRTDPYPNVYLEDDTGRIYFKRVEFEKNK